MLHDTESEAEGDAAATPAERPVLDLDDAAGPADDAGAAPDANGRRRRWLTPRQRNLVEWVVVIGGALVVAMLLRAFLFQTFYIPSGSMMPTLVPGDRVVVSKLADDYNRGDIVVFHRPDTWSGTEPELIKRVIAFEGETVEVRDNAVYIDDQRLNEPYLEDDLVMSDWGPTTVPDGNVFVMGDNRNLSSDSRVNGPVPLDDVLGRTVVRIWPVDSIGRL